jgi:phosphatidylglycerol:prolipoprotein diacylglycerol transferase
MAASGLFLIGYGAFRMLVEFVRVPDDQMGYLAFGWVTTGQALAAPMVSAGVILFVLAQRRGNDAPTQCAPPRGGRSAAKNAG